MSSKRSATELATRLAVEDAVVRMFVATDERNWPVLEDCFTNPFVLDMTSMAGRWSIARLMFKLKFVDGNLELEKAA